MSPDGLPIIDGFAGPDGLMLISGLSGHGFALGPAIGRSAAELILDGRSMLPLEPFRLERFRRRVPVPKKML